MIPRTVLGVASWAFVAPLLAVAALAAAWGQALPAWAVIATAAALIVAVFAAVHHAEMIALRVGEPFGTLVLALCVTVIEVALIASMMLGGGPGADTLARDTVFATVMIVCNGVVGLCLLVGSLRHGVTEFRVEGAGQALSVLLPLSILTLLLPNFTTTTPGPFYSAGQIEFIGAMSLLLYAAFVFVQTVRHRDYFLAVKADGHEDHGEPPTTAVALVCLGLLLACLVAVVGLAKTLAPTIESAVAGAGLPFAVVGIVIALLVLLPETLSAVRAAAANRMQTSLNLTLGSALATIGLTVPAIGALAVVLDLPLALGLPPTESVLLATTLLVATVTLASGRATMLHGVVHLVLFGAFMFLAIIP
jgi:Ca2+:H+ antiporter